MTNRTAKKMAPFLAAMLVLASPCAEAARPERGVASWYGNQHHNRIMANGQPFNQWGYTAAHRLLPLGTQIRIRNLRTQRVAYATVTDRGPYSGRRVLDVSRSLAHRLDMVESGIASVEITVIHKPNRRDKRN